MSTSVTQEVLLRTEQNLQRQLDWSGRYDSRSATILGLGIAMLGFLATEAPPPAAWDCACIIASMATSMIIAGSLYYVYQGQYPRTEPANESLIYFGSIAKLDQQTFKSKVSCQTDDEHFDDLCHQAHLNARLMTSKFASLRSAFVTLVIAVPPWIATIVWFRIVKG
jgi:hypothetical protein